MRALIALAIAAMLAAACGGGAGSPPIRVAPAVTGGAGAPAASPAATGGYNYGY